MTEDSYWSKVFFLVSPLFVKMYNHPDFLPRIIDFLHIILTGYLLNGAKARFPRQLLHLGNPLPPVIQEHCFIFRVFQFIQLIKVEGG